ncbi:MAG: NUDIX domain-containing protein [Dehalococcoidia bacterium]
MTSFRPPQHIRVIAIAVIVHHDHVLLVEGEDETTGRRWFRPPGGAVEFGERAEATVRRELIEEFGREIQVSGLIGITENVFELRGDAGHEIVFEFAARFPLGAAPEDLEPLVGTEGDATFTGRWLPLAEVIAGAHPVVPEGLDERIAAWVNTL